MPVRTNLPKKVVKAFGTIKEEIRSIAEMERVAFEEMSERWHEGDRAPDVEVWLDALDEVVDALDCIELPEDM